MIMHLWFVMQNLVDKSLLQLPVEWVCGDGTQRVQLGDVRRGIRKMVGQASSRRHLRNPLAPA